MNSETAANAAQLFKTRKIHTMSDLFRTIAEAIDAKVKNAPPAIVNGTDGTMGVVSLPLFFPFALLPNVYGREEDAKADMLDKVKADIEAAAAEVKLKYRACSCGDFHVFYFIGTPEEDQQKLIESFILDHTGEGPGLPLGLRLMVGGELIEVSPDNGQFKDFYDFFGMLASRIAETPMAKDCKADRAIRFDLPGSLPFLIFPKRMREIGRDSAKLQALYNEMTEAAQFAGILVRFCGEDDVFHMAWAPEPAAVGLQGKGH